MAQAELFIAGDDLAGLGNGSLDVERKIRVDFRRNAAGHNFGQFEAEIQGEPVCDLACQMIAAAAPKNRLVQDTGIMRHARGFEDQRRICRGVGRPKAADGIHVAGIGDDDCHGFQLFEF